MTDITQRGSETEGGESTERPGYCVKVKRNHMVSSIAPPNVTVQKVRKNHRVWSWMTSKKKKTARQHTHPQSTQSCHTPDWTYWGVFSEQVYGSQLLLRESPIVNTPSVTELLQDPGRQVMKEHTHWSACLNTAQPKQWVTRGVELCPVWPSVSHRHTHNQLTNPLTDASVIQV